MVDEFAYAAHRRSIELDALQVDSLVDQCAGLFVQTNIQISTGSRRRIACMLTYLRA
jgi:hypothetical protein